MKKDYGQITVNALRRATDPIEKARQDLFLADSNIKKRTKYSCGLVSEEIKNSLGCGDYFF
jgi:hypothetical protein